MKNFHKTLLGSSFLLLTTVACNKEKPVSPLSPALAVAEVQSPLSISRSKLLLGKWRTIATGPDLNHNEKLDAAECDTTISTYLMLYTFNGDGTLIYQIALENKEFSKTVSKWYISNNGQELISTSDGDSIRITIQKLTENSFEFYRQNTVTKWFSILSK
jgi:hypothetical protein